METFLKSIGVADELLEHLDQASLTFQRPLLLWLGLVLLLPAGYYVYQRQRDNLSTVPRRFRIALTATRIAILLILVLVFAGPQLRLDQRITKKPIVALLFDNSQSMELPAGPYPSDEYLARLASAAAFEVGPTGEIDPAVRTELESISRAGLAEKVIQSAFSTVLQPLEEDYELRYYALGRQTDSLVVDPRELSFPTDGDTASHIGNGISDALADAAGRQIAGMLLFSDGQNTGGRSPTQAARQAADALVPIFPVALGSAQPIRDLSVVDVYTSGLVAVGDEVGVYATVESQGFDGRPIEVQLTDGDEILDTKQLVARDEESQQVELTFEAKRSGARYLVVKVSEQPEESQQLLSNNTDTAFVRISEEKLKLLIIDGLPRWDFRFVKNAARRDSGLAGRHHETPDILLEAEWKRLSDSKKQEVLPQNVEDLDQYHTVIVGDVSPELFGEKLRDLVIEAVQDRGVGLIVMAGTESMPHRFGSEFRDLLPVRVADVEQGIQAPVYKPFRLEVSPEGNIHETMRLYDDPGRNSRVWGQMPPFYWCANVLRPAPGATVLAYNPSQEGRFGKMPLIAYHYAGEGRVFFVGTDSTWLWRQNVGDRYFYKFWGQAIRFVARRDESSKKSRIEVRPHRAQPGEETKIELLAYDSTGKPTEHPTQSITLLGPGDRQTVELSADETKPGRYEGKFVPELAGVHRLVYQPVDESESVQATVQVLLAPEEFRHPNLNRRLLRMFASSTGGKVLEPNEVNTIPDRLAGKSELEQLHMEASLWDNWLTLLFLMITYSVDVGIRRLIGLS